MEDVFVFHEKVDLSWRAAQLRGKAAKCHAGGIGEGEGL
jgi:hypothetical protein